MNTFFVIIIVCAALVAIVLLLNKLYKNTSACRNHFTDTEKVKAILKEPDDTFDVIVLGSNAPKYAFDFSDIKDFKCTNLAIGPETFQYDLIILKKVINKIRHGGYVVLPICPGKFFLDRYKSRSSYIKYYQILNAAEMPDYCRSEYIRDYKFPLLFHPRALVRLIRDLPSDQRLQIEQNAMTDEEMSKNADWWIYECWNPEFSIDIENMKALPGQIENAVKLNKETIAQIATLCKSHHVNLLMPILPLSSYLASKFSEDYVNQYMKSPIREAVSRQDIKIPDYMHDSRFMDKSNYIDSFFMNRTGAKKFTQVFINENII